VGVCEVGDDESHGDGGGQLEEHRDEGDDQRDGIEHLALRNEHKKRHACEIQGRGYLKAPCAPE